MTKRKPKARRATQRGTVTPTENGRFLARIRLPRNKITGQRGGSSKVFDDADDAHAWLNDERARLARGESIARASGETLEQFLRRFYSEVRVSLRGGFLSRSTCEVDLDLLDCYLFQFAPALASTPLQRLTVDMFREYFRALSNRRSTKDDTRGIAKATVSRVHRVLRARLAFAAQDGKLRFNPMQGQGIIVAGEKKRARRTLSAPQVAAILDVCHTSRFGAYFATLLLTGARPGEVAALQWRDVDFERKTIRIHQSLVRTAPEAGKRGKGETWTLAPTKTQKERTVPMLDELAAILTTHREAQQAIRQLAGPEYEDHDLVHCTEFGKPLHLDTLATRYFRPLLHRAALHLAGEEPLPLPTRSRSAAYRDAREARRAQEQRAIAATNFPMVSLYGCRHSYGSRLSAARVPIRDIADLMGHASPTTTLANYVHSDESTQRAAVASLEEAITTSRRRRLKLA